ncbi:1-phosphatidylinositol 3-phosphate 5-kinase [Schistosoma japonicum]|nr:1-phosphatidylinositol 3-phosphate 5-kinase [Schistosoma japonicum]
MKSSSNNSKGYVSFGVPEFENSRKSSGVLKKFVNRITGRKKSSAEDYDGDCISTNIVQTSEQTRVDCKKDHQVLVNGTPASAESTFDAMSVFPPPNHLSGVIRLPERRYWMQDENCKFCFECGARFTTIRRKHHCRVCGRIFCSQCSNQMVEGTQIGLDGFHRACSYCAEVLITTNTNKSENSLEKHSDRSLNTDNVHGLKKKISLMEKSQKNISHSKSVPSHVSHLSSHNIHMSTGLLNMSNSKALLNPASHLHIQAVDSINSYHLASISSTNEGRDLFPTFLSTTSSSDDHNNISPPLDPLKQTMLSVESNTHGVVRRMPRENKGPILDESLNVDICSAQFKKISSCHSFECLPSSTSQLIFDSPSDNDILYLWSRVWANTPKDVEFSAISDSRLTTTPTGLLSHIHSVSNENLTDNNSCKSLQLFRLRKESEEVYCIYGLVLVYWLVNNLPDLKSCRIKGRLICQKFMDLGLLTDLQNPNCKQFNDDFTFYKLKQIDSDIRFYHQASPRRKTLDSASFCNFRGSSTIDTHTSILGIHEPDWLLEINNSENESSRSSTPYLIEDINDTKSKSSAVQSNFEVGQDISRMRDCSLESLRSTQKWKYAPKPMSINQQPLQIPVQFDSSLCVSTDEYMHNMKSTFDQHIYQLVLQDVRDNLLDPSWASILIRLAWNVCQTVHFDLRSTGLRYFQFNRQQKQPSQSNNKTNEIQQSAVDSNAVYKHKVYSPMDIRYYVHIKKLLCEDNNKSDVFPGVIFTKRPTHKLMPTVLSSPRILLLDSSISYQRTTSKMAWLESQIMQEEEYITNCVCKILCLNPNILFVSGTVCYLAQNYIFKSGIILFSSVKQSVLYRIARMTGADILDSIDRLMSNPTRKSDNSSRKSITRLGVCNYFEVKQMDLPNNCTKFLTFIKNNSDEIGLTLDSSGSCPTRHITHEATVLLQGTDIASLIRAKRCFMFTLRLCYNARLELAYSNNDHIFHLFHVMKSRSRVLSLHKMCLENNTEHSSVSSPVSRKKALFDPNGSLTSISSMVEQSLNDEYDKSAYSDLAIYLQGRLLSVSPSVKFRLPYLASREGQLSYLYAYYTYVIDWPLGRRLNDLMKLKKKVLDSELMALKYCRINAKSNNNHLENFSNDESSHPFTKCNLEISSSPTLNNFRSNRLLSYFRRADNNDGDDSIERNNYALDGLIISETLTSSDEALYADYKARAFMNDNNSDQKDVASFRSFSRLWAGMGSILSGHWDSLFNTKHLKLFKSNYFTATADSIPTSNSQFISESEKRLRRSILDPRSYQSLSFLAILFTTKCIMRPEPCVPPLIATVEFYGSSDLPLGLFLEKFCFMEQHCRNPLCNIVMADHIQRFIQTSGSVQLMIRKLVQDPPRSEVLTDTITQSSKDAKYRRHSRIQMWLFCPICRTNSPIRHMSADTWHLSFVKFLDLIINSSGDWVFCDMINEVNRIDTSKELSPASVRRGIGSQITDSMIQLQCPHSVYKCLEHCFAFDRKLAIFKYQPVNVYEIVMPPSEIRVFPVKINNSKLGSTHTSTAKKTIAENHVSANDFGGDCFTDSTDNTTAVSAATVTSKAFCQTREFETNNFPKTTHLPSYLYTEASEVLAKYYTIYTVIKCHIANLQNETLSCELSAMLVAYLKVLECDSNRILMDERSEILDFLLHPNDNCRKEKSSDKRDTYVADAPLSASYSLDSHSKRLEDCPKSDDKENRIMFKSTEHILTTDAKTINQSHVRANSNNVPYIDTCTSETTTERYGNTQNEITCHDWSKLISSLNSVEQALIVQRLVNELKRWMYRFVSDWNFRFNEYELLMKRIEKNIRDKRKKPTGSHISATTSNSSLQPSGNPLSPSIPSTTMTLEIPTSIITNSISANNLLDSTKSSDHNNMIKNVCSSSNLLFEVSTHCSSVDQNSNRFLTEFHLSSNNISVNSQTSLNSVQTINQLELGHCANNDNKAYKSIENTSRCVTLQSSFNYDSHNLPQQTEDKHLFDTSKHLPVLDPLNLKAVYQRHDPEILTAESASQSDKVEFPSHFIPNENSVSNNASSSGVRRFIHTFLSSAMDLKVFGEPVPTYEHPQLTMCDESCIKILKRYEISLSKSNGMVANSSVDYSRSSGSLCQLLLANPDVYVNDREFTSIIAFALTTPEYERRLVDLHSTLQGSLQQNLDVPLGQPALANFKENELTNTNENSYSTKCISEKEKLNILDNNTSLLQPNEIDSSAKSDISQENNRMSTLSNASTPRDQKPNGFHSASLSSANDKSSGPRSRHIKIQFSDHSTTFFCCVYYASEFFRFRQLVMPNGDMSFIQSLSRCYQWDARGGKSGSLFMKTRDERFVIKELSSIEMKTFHEISQDYFDYLITAALEQRLCVLSRILGIFHVGFKNSASGEAHRFDVLVMENLYYGRTKLAYIYDLKGSLRKRLADESSSGINNVSNNNVASPSSIFIPTNTNVASDMVQEIDETMINPDIPSSHSFTCNQSAVDSGPTSEAITVNHHIPVLLDQNLLNASIDNPLYLRVHSKNALSHCLYMDTAFLANLFIMDYSLLVGVDTTNNQLVIGLIDYLRKFTLDKRLEMIIKQTITSAQGPMPTILTPDLYRERFLYQLHSYFPLLPDQWYDSLTEHTENWRVSVQRKPSSINKKK